MSTALDPEMKTGTSDVSVNLAGSAQTQCRRPHGQNGGLGFTIILGTDYSEEKARAVKHSSGHERRF